VSDPTDANDGPGKAVAAIARIPDRYRDFSVSAEKVARSYRIPDQLLRQLLDLGLPHRGSAAGIRFDRNDLASVVLNLRLDSPKRAAFQMMARALTRNGGRAARRITLQTYCGGGGHQGDCAFVLAPGVTQSEEVAAIRFSDDRHIQLELRPGGGPGGRLDFTAGQRQLVEEARRLEFHPLPFQLNQDLGFLAETSLADCRLAARFIAVRGEQLGVPVRAVTGLLLGRPVAARHFWIEFLAEGEWRPADPFLLTALARWEMLDAALWPPDLSIDGAVLRLDVGPDEPLLSDKGAPGETLEYGLPRRLGPAYFFVS
jgi:hypothetical protein